MKSFSISLPTSYADVLDICAMVGRGARQARISTGKAIGGTSLYVGTKVMCVGAGISTHGVDLGNRIAYGKRAVKISDLGHAPAS